jgi:hypothetical protein
VASRAALRAINLHFHDLRHEAGSRCNLVANEPATEHPPVCNADSLRADNSLVN